MSRPLTKTRLREIRELSRCGDEAECFEACLALREALEEIDRLRRRESRLVDAVEHAKELLRRAGWAP